MKIVKVPIMPLALVFRKGNEPMYNWIRALQSVHPDGFQAYQCSWYDFSNGKHCSAEYDIDNPPWELEKTHA